MTYRAIYFLIGMVVAGPASAETGVWASTNPQVAKILNSCVLATIDSPDGAVTVDWNCVDKRAAEFDPNRFGNGDIYPAIAHILKAVRDGTAK